MFCGESLRLDNKLFFELIYSFFFKKLKLINIRIDYKEIS